MGFVNGVGYFVAAFSAKIFAALVTVDALGKKDYTYGSYFIAICVAAGVIAASRIKTKKNVQQQNARPDPAS